MIGTTEVGRVGVKHPDDGQTIEDGAIGFASHSHDIADAAQWLACIISFRALAL